MCGRREGSRATAGRPEGCSVHQTNKQTNKQAETAERARENERSRRFEGLLSPGADVGGVAPIATESAEIVAALRLFIAHRSKIMQERPALRRAPCVRWTTLTDSHGIPRRAGIPGRTQHHAAWDSVAYADITGHERTGPDEHLPVQDDDRRALEHRPLAELERVQPAAVVHLPRAQVEAKRNRGAAHVRARACACVRVRACACVCARARVCVSACA